MPKKAPLPSPEASASVITETKTSSPSPDGTLEVVKTAGGEEIIPEQPTEKSETQGQIHLKLGVTIGLPDYSSVRVDVGITTPVDIEDNPGEVFDEVKAWVTERLQAEANELIEGMSSE